MSVWHATILWCVSPTSHNFSGITITDTPQMWLNPMQSHAATPCPHAPTLSLYSLSLGKPHRHTTRATAAQQDAPQVSFSLSLSLSSSLSHSLSLSLSLSSSLSLTNSLSLSLSHLSLSKLAPPKTPATHRRHLPTNTAQDHLLLVHVCLSHFFFQLYIQYLYICLIYVKYIYCFVLCFNFLFLLLFGFLFWIVGIVLLLGFLFLLLTCWILQFLHKYTLWTYNEWMQFLEIRLSRRIKFLLLVLIVIVANQ
jgi:hypothetical protein